MVSMTQNSTERHRIAQKVKKMFKNGLKEARKDSFTLKVLKMQFVFGSAMISDIAHSISNVPDHGSAIRQIPFLGPLE